MLSFKQKSSPLYEEKGLLHLERVQGKRMYSKEDVMRLHCISYYRELDFSLEQIQQQLMISRDELLENQRQVDDVLFYIRQCKEWDAADYADILSLQNQERPYSLKTHLIAYLRNMTLLKAIILIFYTLDTIRIVALIGAITSFLFT